MELNLEMYDEKGKVKHSLTYPVALGDMKIEPIDNSAFKSRGVKTLNDDFKSRLEELKKQYIDLLKDYEENKIVYESEFKFEPIVGHTYFLYRKDNGKSFLSLIEPKHWKCFELIGEYTLNYNGKWIKKIPE